MPVMAEDSTNGFSQMIVSPITVSVMVRPCVFHLAHGQWIADSVQEQECGRQTYEKEQSCPPRLLTIIWRVLKEQWLQQMLYFCAVTISEATAEIMKLLSMMILLSARNELRNILSNNMAMIYPEHLMRSAPPIVLTKPVRKLFQRLLLLFSKALILKMLSGTLFLLAVTVIRWLRLPAA